MARKVATDSEAKTELWSQLERGQASMLWVEGSGQHPQPMSHFPDQADPSIWFITSSDTDLAAAIGRGAEARMTFVSPKQDFHASLKGTLGIVQDDDKLDELWSLPVAAWFEKGREDPTIRLLRFTPQEAAIWANEANRFLVGLKLLGAGLREGAAEPDIGVHRVVSFGQAA